MKKAYNKPTMTVVKIQQMQMLCESVTGLGTNLGDDGFELGGGSNSSAQALEITDFMGEEF